MNDLDRAIAIIEDSRQTHVNWADWRRKGNGTDTDHEMIGDLEWHENAIRDYDHVLAVLRAAPLAEGPADACDGAISWPHYHRDTPDGEEVVRLHPEATPVEEWGEFGAAPRAEGLDVDWLASALYKRDYPRAPEPYNEWFAATGDRQYADEATVILGYLALPSRMRPDWSTSWADALSRPSDESVPEEER